MLNTTDLGYFETALKKVQVHRGIEKAVQNKINEEDDIVNQMKSNENLIKSEDQKEEEKDSIHDIIEVANQDVN